MSSRPLGLALLLAASASCTGEDQPLTIKAAPIVNGQKNTADPAVVLVAWPNFICSGTLVAEQVVITARHCVASPEIGHEEPQGIHTVSFGNGWDGQWTTVGTTGYAYVPPDPNAVPFTDPFFETDIAVLFLAEPAPPDIKPVPVNVLPLEAHPGLNLRLVGFGDTGSGGAGVKRVGTTMSWNLHPTLRLLYHLLAPSATCSGDSGGAQLMTIDGTEFLVGVTSFGQQSCSAGAHGAVRVDRYIDWLGQYFDTRFDKVAPSVTITSPGEGASVAAGFTVTADASDDRKVAHVQLKVDGMLVATDATVPYVMSAPMNLPSGEHTIEVIASDPYRNQATATRAVTVAAACTTDADCPEGLACSGGVCAGAIGAACSSSGDCASGQCYLTGQFDGICTTNCSSDSECPADFACSKPAASPVTKCFPAEGGGGCAIAPTGRAGALPLALLVGLATLVLARRRSRRR
jgi:hypothetical protein